MSDVTHWLESVGFPEYARCFAENNVDDEILAHLTDKDLQDIGVGSLGHRRKLLRAIGAIDIGDRHATASPLLRLAIPNMLNASLLAQLDCLAPVYEIAQIGAA